MGSQTPPPPPEVDYGTAGTPRPPSPPDAVVASKPARRSSQVMALILGIVFLAIAALGLLTVVVINVAFATMDFPQDFISGFQVLIVAFGILGLVALELMGWILVVLAVPGVAAISLYARITRPRVVVNSVIAALWLVGAVSFVASMLSYVTFQSLPDFVDGIVNALWPLVFPVTYAVCVVRCGLDLSRGSQQEGPRPRQGPPPPPMPLGQSLDEGHGTT